MYTHLMALLETRGNPGKRSGCQGTVNTYSVNESSFNIHKTRPLCVLHKLSTAPHPQVSTSQALKQAPLCLPGLYLHRTAQGTRLALQLLSASPGARHPCLSNSEDGFLALPGRTARTLPEHLLSRALLPPFCHLLALPSPTKCEPDKTKAQRSYRRPRVTASHHCNGWQSLC